MPPLISYLLTFHWSKQVIWLIQHKWVGKVYSTHSMLPSSRFLNDCSPQLLALSFGDSFFFILFLSHFWKGKERVILVLSATEQLSQPASYLYKFGWLTSLFTSLPAIVSSSPGWLHYIIANTTVSETEWVVYVLNSSKFCALSPYS